jgi:N-hydroxyarylamine O-acetyltransferase
MNSTQVDAYLARIHATAESPDAATLRELQRAHLCAVPFENLSIHLGEPIVLDEQALFEKIVVRGRGGFCYELNGAFAALLTALGYRVTRMAARVNGGGRLGPPLDHMALRVDLDQPWLVDVGFGQFSRYPLRLDVRDDQADPSGVFRIADNDGFIEVSMDGSLQYRLDPWPYALSDFVPTCWWQQTSPQSHFTQSLTCSLPTESGRVTLSGNRLIRTVKGEREESLLPEQELLAAYQTHFGIELTRVPTLQVGQRRSP